MDRMAKIKKVYLDDLSVGEKVDMSLEIRLDNGQIIILSLNDKGDDPRFADIVAGRYMEQPTTDGERVYLPGGSSIGLNEIIATLRNGETTHKRDGKRWITAASLCVATAAVVFAAMAQSQIRMPNGNQAEGDRLTLNDQDIPLGSMGPDIAFSGLQGVTVPADTIEVDIPLINPEGNTCYFTFEIVADGETLYTSQFLKPGGRIENVTLRSPLARGEYDAVLKITAYAIDTLTEIDNVNVDFILTAE